MGRCGLRSRNDNRRWFEQVLPRAARDQRRVESAIDRAALGNAPSAVAAAEAQACARKNTHTVAPLASRSGREPDWAAAELVRTLADWPGLSGEAAWESGNEQLGLGSRKRLGRKTKNPLPGGKRVVEGGLAWSVQSTSRRDRVSAPTIRIGDRDDPVRGKRFRAHVTRTAPHATKAAQRLIGCGGQHGVGGGVVVVKAARDEHAHNGG